MIVAKSTRTNEMNNYSRIDFSLNKIQFFYIKIKETYVEFGVVEHRKRYCRQSCLFFYFLLMVLLQY